MRAGCLARTQPPPPPPPSAAANPLAFAGPHHPAFLPEFVTLADLFELHRALDRVLCRHAADLGTPAHGVLGRAAQNPSRPM